ncbi:SDR family oxidoreductase [Candidatus Pelagibacter sp.]|nr:SDR family oxidoreductase [Candidatus Pelagibacter sp.]
MKKKILIIGGCGYIGSRLVSFFDKKYYSIKILDNEIYGDPIKINNYKNDFKDININQLQKYECIIFLAAHSSVKSCNEDINGAINNNIINTKKLIDKIKKIPKIKFIFASSAAIYNGSFKPAKEENKINFIPNQLYDISKFYMENYIIKHLKKYYILRFSTVSGCSPNQNKDLIVNKMYFDSIKSHKITVVNPNTKKSILFIDDLCRAIIKIVAIKKENMFGVYNLSSLNLTIGQIAKKISNFKKSKIIKKKGITNYSFYTSNKKFSKNFNFKFTRNIKYMIESFNL